MTIEHIILNTPDVDFYSPFSGICILGEKCEQDPTAFEDDPTCLFSYYENSGWGHISKRANLILESKGITNIDDLTPIALAHQLDIHDLIVFEYNGGFNGIYWFAFAPLAA